MKGYKLLHRDSRTVLIHPVASRLLPEGTRHKIGFFSLWGNLYQSLYCHELRSLARAVTRASCWILLDAQAPSDFKSGVKLQDE